MCFLDDSPYSHRVFYELLGLKAIRVEKWVKERNESRRKINFIIPETNSTFKQEIRVSATENYTFCYSNLTLQTKYSFKNPAFAGLSIETLLDIKAINMGEFQSLVTHKLFLFTDDQKKVSKKLLEPLSTYFKMEQKYWAKEILEFRLVASMKRNRAFSMSEKKEAPQSELSKALESISKSVQTSSNLLKSLAGFVYTSDSAQTETENKNRKSSVTSRELAKQSSKAKNAVNPHLQASIRSVDRMILYEYLIVIFLLFAIFKLAIN